MHNHCDKSKAHPVSDGVNESIDHTRRKLHCLQEEVRSEVLKLGLANAERLATETAKFVQAIRNSRWAAAAEIGTSIFRLIRVQLEVEELLTRNAHDGGHDDGRSA